MKGGMGQQISYLTVIVVHSTMHLMHHNHCLITTNYTGTHTCIFSPLTVQVSEEDNDLPLRQVLKIVHFLFKEELLVLSPDSELTVPSINLITAIFQYCEFPFLIKV